MIPRRFSIGWAIAALSLLFLSAPALAAPADLTARPTAYAANWPPGDLLVSATPAVALAEREDLADPAAYRARGPVSKASHLFTAAGRFAAAHRTTRPSPG